MKTKINNWFHNIYLYIFWSKKKNYIYKDFYEIHIVIVLVLLEIYKMYIYYNFIIILFDNEVFI